MRGVLDIPPDLAPVGEAVAEALSRVERRFGEALETSAAPMAGLCRHVERYRGKMLRPVLAVVSGLAGAESAPTAFAAGAERSLITDDLITVATVVEMVHMATLVHDDVLDEADVRRRGATINALHGNEPAVILGDYLIAAAYHLCSTIPDPAFALAIAKASRVVCEGELLQLHHRGDWDLGEDAYFDIIARKTGALTAVSCRLGAMAAGAAPAAAAALESFGDTLGRAFQIQDDLLDLAGTQERVGKSVGKDAEKGKPTLPVIHHLRTADADRRAETLALLERSADGGGGGAALREALAATGSIDFAAARARGLVADAKAGLRTLPPSPARDVLDRLADAVTARSY